MSSKALSPGAQLLRQSRLMAMPPPLPGPSIRETLPVPAHPTMQIIASPRSSASRGEWGLKRDLPLGPSQKTHYMKYQDLDTINHMTTFQSGQEDFFTLRKWQEMDITLTKGSEFLDPQSASSKYVGAQSVFDGKGEKPEGYIWRYKGPYVQNMTPGELKEYIQKSVKSREPEFYAFVCRSTAADKIKKDAAEMGQTVSPEEMERFNAMELPEIDIQALRSDLPLLERLTVEFLNIPMAAQPHSTHPSAGLYYTRSNTFAHHDPDLGPQERKKVFAGRVMNNQTNVGQIVGIGGVMAKAQRVGYNTGLQRKDRLEINQYRPVKANIDARGRIMLEVERVRGDGEGLGESGRNRFGDSMWGRMYDQPERDGQATEDVVNLLAKFQDRKRDMTKRESVFPRYDRNSSLQF